ncbi:damage-control phosphatase ARMT1 family protein [Hydrogenimonas sp.]
MTPECVVCIFSQALRVCRTLGVEEATAKAVLDRVGCMVPAWRFDENPPQVASRVYPEIGTILQREDIYAEVKAEATRHAEALLPVVKERVARSPDRLTAALKAAVAGNVIDLAATHTFDLEAEVAKIFDTPFALDDSGALRDALGSARRLLVVGDNAGEHLFDKLLMETVASLYPGLTIAYAVRGVPIINDVTRKEAEEAGIGEVAEILDSGVDTPGLDLSRAGEPFLAWYDSADVVIAKGMGNYECLEDTATRPTWFLLKIKCEVVAASLGREVGDIVCYKGGCDA